MTTLFQAAASCRSILRSPSLRCLLLATLFATLPGVALGQGQSGNFCVRDFQPGAVCTANDVRIEALTVVSVNEDCVSGVPGETEVVFQTLISSDGSPDRYDVGFYLALDGGSARDGDSCYHDYLEPPLTTAPTYGDVNTDTIDDIVDGPWWDDDSDTCGDIESNTQLFKTLPPLRFACIDTNGDGSADVSVCTSWDNNDNTACNAVGEAFPGTNSKCSCSGVELGIAAEPAITVVKSPAMQAVTSGGTADFTFTVTSKTTISNVVVSDPDCDAAPAFTGGDAGNDTLLTPDETWTYTCSKTNVMADFTNTVTVTGDGPLGGVMDEDSADVVVSSATMSLAKSGTWNDADMDGRAEPGETISYEFEVSNTGSVTLTDVAVTDPLTGLPAIACPSGNPIPMLAVATSETCAATLMLDQATIDSGGVDNTASADSNEVGPVEDSASVALPGAAELSLTKTGTFADDSMDGVAQAGETIDYEFVVTNTGSLTLAPVAVTDPGVSPITCTGGNPIPTLAPGAMVTCTGSYVIQAADVTAGQKDNTATATGQDPFGDSVQAMADETTPLPRVPAPAPAVEATKESSFVPAVHDNDGNGFLSPGDDLSYTVVMVNNGPGDALDVTFTDSPDANTTLVVGSVTATTGTVVTGNGIGDTSVEVDLGTLAAGGGMATVTYEVTVDDPLADGVTMLVNQGLVSGSNFSELPTDDPSTADDDDPTMVPVADDAIGIPTLSAWALALLALLLAGVAVRFLVR